MHIAFKFEYIHDNGLFTRLLKRIEEISTIPLTLAYEGTSYTIEASGDQPTLETLADLISRLVPQSLFLKDYKIEAVKKEAEEQKVVEKEAKNDKVEELFLDATTTFQVPYCPECQESVAASLNPFTPCSVCGFTETSLTIEELTTATGIEAVTAETFFNQAADILMKEGEITVPTYNGMRYFSLLDSNKVREKGILYCDPTDISTTFLITQGELDALMMVEKPSIRLKPKLMFRAEHGLEALFYPVFFPDDKVTLALTTVLKNKGIDAICSDKVPKLRVASALEEHPIITSGRDMLPWNVSLGLASPSFCEYGGFQAYGDSVGLRVDRKIDLGNKPFIHYIVNTERSQAKNVISFEPAHAAQRSIVVEHQLENKALCGIHLSRDFQSHFFSFSNKIGYTPMVLFRDEDIIQPRDMLRAIESMDEGGERLVKNFKNGFPELYETIENQELTMHTDISDVTKIWAMAASFIGLYDGEDALKSCEILESTAIEFGGKSGPRIDYKIISTEEGYQLDARLAIRSAMSFKLAGLDDYLLSFGFIDSLADFIAQQAEDADANIGIEGVTLSGSLFENRQLLMRAYNALSMNYTVYRNKRLSVDSENVAFGAITLGNE